MQWFAVRTVFRHGQIAADTGIFEEKITIYHAADADAALEMARRDAASYLDLNKGFVQVEKYGVFMLGHGDDDLNGREVWSQLSEGPLNPGQFYRDKYEKFESRSKKKPK